MWNFAGQERFMRELGSKVWLLVWGGVLALGIGLGVLLSVSKTQVLAQAGLDVENRTLAYAKTNDINIERILTGLVILQNELEDGLKSGVGIREGYVKEMMEKMDWKEKGNSLRMRVVRLNGDIMLGEGVNQRPRVNYADREWFNALKRNPTSPVVMSKLLYGKVAKAATLVFAVAYRDKEGNFAGVVLAALEQENLLVLARAYQLKDMDAVELHEAKGGDLLARIPKPAQGYKLMGVEGAGTTADPNELAKGCKGKSARRPGSDGVDRIVSCLLMGEGRMYAMVGVGVEQALSGWHDQLVVSVSIWFIFLIISVLAGKVLVTWNKKMLSANDQVKALNGSLEAQVASRTADLEDALNRLRQGQDELAHAERLASLGGMVASVAHELNTPLGNALLTASSLRQTAIKLASKMGEEKIKRAEAVGLAQRVVEMSGLIEESVEKAADLVQAFKQVAVDQTSQRRREFDLKESVLVAIKAMEPMINRSNGKVVVQVNVQEGLVCDSYPGAVAQIMNNLIQNALKHGFDGLGKDGAGTITIEGKWGQGEKGQEAVVEFADNGAGVSPENVPKLFDAFFTTKANSGGSGLGLSVSRELARQALGGELSYEPAEQGARFVLRFPVKAIGAVEF